MSTALSVRLRELRQQRGLTQIQLAQRARVRQGTLSDWESGKVEHISAALFERVCTALGVHWTELAALSQPTGTDVDAHAARLTALQNLERDMDAQIAKCATVLHTARACRAACTVDTPAWRAAVASVDAATVAYTTAWEFQRAFLAVSELVCAEWDAWRKQFADASTPMNGAGAHAVT
jgi:transcriptional regulator with XRE-family HTH domain